MHAKYDLLKVDSDCLIFLNMSLLRRATQVVQAAFASLISHPPRPAITPRRQKSQHRNSEFSLTVKQIQRLIHAASSRRDKVMIRIFAETGMRRAELAALRWEDIDFENKLLVIRNGKGSKMRVLPMTNNTAQILMFFKPSSEANGYVFTSRQSTTLSLRQINRIVGKVGIQAGLQNPNPKYSQITCHSFRHSFAHLWKDKGGRLDTLATLMGHADPATTLAEYGRDSFAEIQRRYQQLVEDAFRPSTRSHKRHKIEQKDG